MNSDTLVGFAIIAATLLGPILAVLVTRWNDSRRDQRARKMFVFRALMRTRRMPYSQEHVGALNLVEVDFNDCARIIEIFKELTECLKSGSPHLSSQEAETINDRANRIKARMLGEMAKNLHYKFGEIDLYEGGYIPSVWTANADADRAVRDAASQLFEMLTSHLARQSDPNNQETIRRSSMKSDGKSPE